MNYITLLRIFDQIIIEHWRRDRHGVSALSSLSLPVQTNLFRNTYEIDEVKG